MESLINKLKQRVPILKCNIEEELIKQGHISDSAQSALLEVLIEASIYNPFYSKSALKRIVEHLERTDIEINEAFYEYLIEWLPSRELEPTDVDLISYPLGKGKFTKIMESPNLISGLGTTGLRTWEASLFLTDYLLNSVPQSIFQRCFEDKTILELGCGTGFVGISLVKFLEQEVNNVILTDGDSQLIDKLSTNLIVNDLDLESSNISVCKLWWGEDKIPQNVKTIVAADVTYDSTIIPSLIEVLKDGIVNANVEDIFLGATVRNEETLKVWEDALNENQKLWSWEKITQRASGGSVSGEQLYYRPQTAEIFVYHVTASCANQ